MKPREQWGPADELADAILWGAKAASVVVLFVLCWVGLAMMLGDLGF